MIIKVRKHSYNASGGQEKLCMAAKGGMQGKGWHTLLLCGGVLLSFSFRCLGVVQSVSSYLVANG